MSHFESLDRNQLDRLREIATSSLTKNEEYRLSSTLNSEDQTLSAGVKFQDFLVTGDSIQFSDIDTRDQLAVEHYFHREPFDSNLDPISRWRLTIEVQHLKRLQTPEWVFDIEGIFLV